MRTNKLGRLIIAAVLSISAAAAVYALLQKPAASAATFTTISGKKIALDDLRGKIVLINFWATSCGICMAEMPELIATYRQYQKQGFEVVGIAMSYDDLDKVRQYVAKQALPFPVVFDKSGDLARDYGQVKATPTTFVIDKSGQRVSKTIGIINFDKLHAFLDSALVPRN